MRRRRKCPKLGHFSSGTRTVPLEIPSTGVGIYKPSFMVGIAPVARRAAGTGMSGGVVMADSIT